MAHELERLVVEEVSKQVGEAIRKMRRYHTGIYYARGEVLENLADVFEGMSQDFDREKWFETLRDYPQQPYVCSCGEQMEDKQSVRDWHALACPKRVKSCFQQA